MAGIVLDAHQLEAIDKMKNGCILCGGVGSGKSRTSLTYYYILNGGRLNSKNHKRMQKPQDLYIITTARKRDQHEWEEEFAPFYISKDPKETPYKHEVVIDSWNNIKKYSDVTGAFFIFDEQRVIGAGTWVKAYLKIAKKNNWVLLSATPGDTWEDYIPVFLANGFYKNRTELLREHAVYSRFTKFPKIERFIGTDKLIAYKKSLLVPISVEKLTRAHHEKIITEYDRELYKRTTKTRWDPYKDEPIQNAGVLCYIWRKIVNSDESRHYEVLKICHEHPKAIIFYNFDYELDVLKRLDYGKDVAIAEWNGHAHEDLPSGEKWVYLVQYTAGCEGWNCVTTDTIIFYSQNYSYKVMVQAAGRTDRRNTPYIDLYYYHLKSRAPIDLGISRSLADKKQFNAKGFTKW